MNALYFLIPVASLLALSFLGLFLWANKNNQYEDLDTPANRMLLDDEQVTPTAKMNYQSQKKQQNHKTKQSKGGKK